MFGEKDLTDRNVSTVNLFEGFNNALLSSPSIKNIQNFFPTDNLFF